ncbi:MAG TPA: aspartate carbamoyltransferase catalytic subunit [Anaerohalosphaeraceae bacterium]|nr:aspartate carbamoyltransferase catalytic subunit [Phycisphaerae bacterium]HOK95931.1 aspartate carbamoyltransferase catalytic subunit [Anaerohalosphaeraceae bacterium]HOL30623.1 aspartate carbamoyltransferase catalytic subunit [Anaerohalosphaeraceae bacterium]HOM75288.1 aspartate carbamoyltransferase catalytic subunit [Anaerohalosphaeraceae bacterium]HPC63112.1 aspartate carbamoyltransferase catalytic subunit [Anaerohalosphaeraceae bacterium]
MDTQTKTEKFQWTRKHLIGLSDLSRREIEFILDTAQSFEEFSTRSIKKAPPLRGKVVVNMFFEDSTRTRNSFTLAASRLSADVIEFTEKSSSVSKGETLIDTARNLEAMGVDIVVIRHSAGGAPKLLTRCINACVVNAGDGYHEHPTQALLDVYTIRQVRGSLDGLKIGIVGDIAHSRVARSNIYAMTKLGAEVTLVGPPTLMPARVQDLPVKVSYNLDAVIEDFDVINMLRIQFERLGGNPFPSVREYSHFFGLTVERLKRAKPDILVMHPGPMNRGVEIESEVADGPNSVILRQVANGLAVRMAVLFLVNQAAAQEQKEK